MLFFFFAGGIVNVGEGVKFVDYDVDVVASDSVTLAGDALAFVGTRNGMELATADFVFDGVEVGSNSIYTSWVADEDNTVCQKFGLQMKVETGAVTVDDEFGLGEMLCSHSFICL